MDQEIGMTLQDFIDIWNGPDDRLLVHTSGSTGTPKPMWVEKSRMLSSARITCDFLGLKSGDKALLCLPLDYIAGKMMAVRSIERGLDLICVEPSNHPLAGLTGSIEPGTDAQRIDFAAMVPSQVFCSLQVPQEREILSRIRHLIIGGGAISRELQEAISGLGSSAADCSLTACGSDCSMTHCGAIWSTYGMTETLSHIALRRLNGPEASEWYTPFEGVGISLNEEGCLVIDAPHVHEGTLVTNDIAEIMEGRFRILGRRDNVICSGGVKLQIEKIEEKLRDFLHGPFCITRRKDPKFGEVAVLMVERRDSTEESVRGEGEKDSKQKKDRVKNGLKDGVLEKAFSHLEPYERPKAIVYVDSIPMTPTGKIARAEAERLAQG